MSRKRLLSLITAGLFLVSAAAYAQQRSRTPPPSMDSVKKAGPPPKLEDGHPDFTGVYFPGSVPDVDHYSQEAPAHRTFDPRVTPQEPPSFQTWVQQKIKLMG